MTAMYAWPEAARLLITVLLTLCVSAQTLALVLSCYRHPRSPRRMLENALELSVLLQILVSALLHGQVMQGFEMGIILPSGYEVWRSAAFALTALLAMLVIFSIKKLWPLSVIAASALTLPIAEKAASWGFALIYTAVMLFWLLRGIHICIMRAREIKTGLSALSVKEAIDALPSGLLFGEDDGFILLSNRQMQRLMEIISGRVRRDGRLFYRMLSEGSVRPGCAAAELEGQIVCLLPDESAWMFTKTQLAIRDKGYIQLTATDITRRWKLTARLQRQEAELRRKSEELSEAIANIHVLSSQRETQKAKMRAHDILGQRLTLLLRTIRSEETLGHDALQALSQGLMEDLKTGQEAPSAENELESLRQAFASIGVEIEVGGALPGDEAKGSLFVDIIRECVTNAVRHGFATKVSVRIENAEGHRLEITNNGHPPAEPIIEGGGIGGMRKKVEPHGGALDVAARPQFVLTVSLPGEDLNE